MLAYNIDDVISNTEVINELMNNGYMYLYKKLKSTIIYSRYAYISLETAKQQLMSHNIILENRVITVGNDTKPFCVYQGVSIQEYTIIVMTYIDDEYVNDDTE